MNMLHRMELMDASTQFRIRRRRRRRGGLVVGPRRHPSSSRVMPLKQMMKYGVPVILALLVLRYQLEPDELFQRNPAPVWCFVAATATYWLSVGAMVKNRSNGLRVGALASGIQAALSLLSMFLHHPLSLLPLLLFPVAAAAFFAYARIVAAINKMPDTNQPHSLPV